LAVNKFRSFAIYLGFNPDYQPMRTAYFALLAILYLFVPGRLGAQVNFAAFTSADTVCVNQPVNFSNTSVGATSYFWNFCVADLNAAPVGVNLGNPGSLSQPVFMDIVSEGGNYYAFVVNHNPGGIVRLDFGNSMLNTPTSVFLGNPNNALNLNYGNEGIQIVKANGSWYALIVGGNPVVTGNTPRLVTVKFGPSLTNTTPTAINWGNIGGMLEPLDLHVFEQNGNWYGLTVNAVNNTITRFNFTNNLDNAPTGTNLGNVGSLAYPDGIYAVNDNGFWRAFVTNGTNGSITRLDFGSSLLNSPTGINLGNPGGNLSQPRDLTILNDCGQAVGFVVNANNNSISRINFSSLSSAPSSSVVGNLGNLNFPHSLSKLFRVGNDVYSLITNVSNNTITRLQFSGCSNSTIPSSTLQTPPPITYNNAGTYSVSLTINDGLPTQSSFCKKIVVLAKPTITPIPDYSICPGNSVNLVSNATGATTFSWSPSTGLSNSNISNPVASPSVTTTYIVTASNGFCSVTDTITVNVLSQIQCGQQNVLVGFTAPDTVCVNSTVPLVNTSNNASSYFWSFCSGNLSSTPVATNIGNPGGILSQPVFMDLVKENGNYYGFVVNHNPGGIVRLDFGSSFLNTPTAVNLGNPGNVMNASYGNEGIQVVKANGSWYAIIVGGNPNVMGNTPRLVTVKLGASITNPNPTAINWGNVGNMLEPIDLFLFTQNNNWYGFTVNAVSNTITRFDFTSSFDNVPTGVNLGNVGALNYPDGISVVNDNGTWRAFITNASNSTLTRLDFGNSLLNTPSGVNLGYPGGSMLSPRDLTIFNDCNQALGFVANSTNTITRLNFTNLTTTPTTTNLGNIGNLNFAHSITRLFREGNDVYSFVTNVNNNTITRLRFQGCSNSTIPSSALVTPSISYSSPGTYYINLTVDEGLPTQNSFCKKIVVVNAPVLQPLLDGTICPGSSFNFTQASQPGVTYAWTPVAGLSNPTISNPVASPSATTNYTLTASMGSCVVKDTATITLLTPQQCTTASVVAGFTAPDTVCLGTSVNAVNTSQNGSTYYWNFCSPWISSTPTGVNIPNPGNLLTVACFTDYVNVNGNYYGFITSNNPASLVRLDYGNSLLNTPTAVNLGNFGNAIPYGAQGIQIVNEGGNWFILITGGDIAAVPTATSRIVKLDFGSNITNTNPVVTNWGNIGSLNYPHELYVFKEAGNWYGYTVNLTDGTLTRFDFGSNFNNPPIGTNLGNLGGMSQPNGFFFINDNGAWRMFVSNFANSTLTRIDFGSSLLNTPSAAVNLGNLGGVLQKPRDLQIFSYCGQNVAYVLNELTNSVALLNFTSLSATPTAVSLGNIGGLGSPHSFSEIFRVGNDLYAFAVNSLNSITRLKFTGCVNPLSPNTAAQNPPAINFPSPGVYTIGLLVDEGLFTQTSFCKNVVVLAAPAITPMADATICPGNSHAFNPAITGGVTFSWSPATGLSNPNIANPVASPSVNTTYILTVTGAGGCVTRDTVNVNLLTPVQCGQLTVTPAFTIPDTVCLGTPVTITNTSVNASSYLWSFCAPDLNAAPTGSNLPNPNGQLTTPCFLDYVNVNGNYYGFITNNNPASLVRLDYGNSLLNTPTAVNLGNFGNIIPLGAQGIQVINEGGSWFAIITGGDIAASPAATSRIIKIDFGPNITNTTPIATNWGNIGSLSYPVELSMFKLAGIWYGFTVNYYSATITRFTFGPNFNSPPTGVNLGGASVMSQPNGICPVNDNGTWRLFVANFGNSTITRFDFGNSLLNAPTGSVNLGTLGNVLHSPRDLQVFNYCGQNIAFVVNDATHDVVRLNFNGLATVPTATSLGIIGGTTNPHSISKIFRSGDDVFAFIPNSYVNSISRVRFPGCNNASMPNTNVQNPAPISYSTPGTYNINLTVDEGLPSQAAYCKKVVVLSEPQINALPDTAICIGSSVILNPNVTGATTFSWSPASGLSNTTIVNPVASPSATTDYILTASNFGCVDKDTIRVNVSSLSPSPLQTLSLCNSATVKIGTGISGAQYQWNTNATTDSITVTTSGTYWVQISKNGCSVRDSFVVSLNNLSQSPTQNLNLCSSATVKIGTGIGGAQYLWSNATIADSITVSAPGTYWVQITKNGCTVTDSFIVTQTALAHQPTQLLAFCNSPSVKIGTGNPGAQYQWNTTATTDSITVTASGTYWVQITKNSCIVRDSFVVNFNALTQSPTQILSICNSPSIKIGAPITGGSYIWNTSAATDSIIVSSSGTYWVQSLKDGCSVTDSFVVSLVNLASAPLQTFTVCNSPGIKIGASVGMAAYTWSTGATTDSITVSNSGTYLVQITKNGCSVTDSIVVNMNSLAHAPTQVLSLCNSTTMKIGSGISGAQYLWNTLSTTDSIIVTSPGIYWINITKDGCSVTDSFTVSQTILTHTPTQTLSLCNVPSVKIGTSVSGATYQWSNAAVTDSITVTTSGTYWVQVTKNGCTVRDSFLVNINSLAHMPTQSLGLCNGNSIKIGSPVVSGASYQWSTASTTDSIIVTQPGTYWVMLSSNGCTVRDSFVVSFTTKSPITWQPKEISKCIGDSVLFSASGGTSYNWQPAASFANPNASSTKGIISTSGNYSVTISEQVCFSDTTINILVTAFSRPQVEIVKSNDVNCSNDSSILKASGASTYDWTPSSQVVRYMGDQVTVKPQLGTVFYVMGTDMNGCRNVDSILVNFINEGDQKLFVPDAFTPNGDGLNDVFRPIFSGPAKNYEFSIYNRWGELVFRTTTPGLGWNGYFRNKIQPGDVFVYYIQAEGGCNGKFFKKGTFVLIR